MAEQAKRQPVDYNYTALNWTFIKGLAKIAQYAAGKYGSAEQYLNSRLEDEKSPINHAIEHLVLYMQGVPHDHFNTIEGQLWAAGYNVMMELGYMQKFGWVPQKLAEKIKARLFNREMGKLRCTHKPDDSKANQVYCSTCKGVVAHFADGWFKIADGDPWFP